MQREALRGRPAISYLRFSSTRQESGSTIERQQETLDRVIAHYGLVLDHTLTDRAKSASKGHHRTKGFLGVLLGMLGTPDVPVGTVLIIEAIDRLCREPFTVSIKIISDLIAGGMIVVTGDLTVWNATTINSSANHKLVAEINAAYEYARRLGELSAAGHKARRIAAAKFAEDPEAPVPNINGRLPAWITRTKGKTDYRLHPERTEAVRRIFQMSVDGQSCQQIARLFNEEKMPLWPGMKAWKSSRIGKILLDRHALGYYQPAKYVQGQRKNPLGPEIRPLPAAIDAGTWIKVQEALSGRKRLRGRRGTATPNMFSGKAFCPKCFGALYAVTGGGRMSDGSRKRRLQCSGYVERAGCDQKQYYDLVTLDEQLLPGILVLCDAVPKTVVDTSAITQEIAELQLLIGQKTAAVDALIALITPADTSLAATVAKLSAEREPMTRKLSELCLKRDAALAAVDTEADWQQMAKTLVLPALKGQADARETMRDLLSRVDFHIIGDLGTPGGMIIRMGGIHSDPDNAERLVEMAVSPGNREVRLTAIGKWFRDNQAEVMRDIRQQFGDG